MEYRKAKGQDWQAIIPLVNEAFKDSAPMEKAFPFLFNESNNTSYVASDNGEIIAFIGGVPSIFTDKEKNYASVSIGSVCTKEAYRGMGIADKLLKRALLDYKNADFSFALISGERELYLRNGFEFFGKFRAYAIIDYHKLRVKDEYKYVISSYKDDVESLLKIYELYNSKEVRFSLGLNEFKQLVDSKAIISINKMEREIVLAHENGRTSAFVIMGIRKEEEQSIGQVVEYGGSTEGVLYILKAMGELRSLDSIRFVVNEKEEQWMPYLQEQEFEEISNQGTYLPFKEDICKEAIPYTCSLSYV